MNPSPLYICFCREGAALANENSQSYATLRTRIYVRGAGIRKKPVGPITRTCRDMHQSGRRNVVMCVS